MKKSFRAILPLLLLFLFCIMACNRGKTANVIIEKKKIVKSDSKLKSTLFTTDTVDYNKRILALSNSDTSGKWPVKTPYPLNGAVLPYNRIIAFYGNLYSKRMGVLGELPKEVMLKKLQLELSKWQAADTTLQTRPALHYIAVTAQSAAGKDGKHRQRMPFKQIDTILSWAKPIHALVFLDIQIGHSSVKDEVTTLENYLKLPNVHLGIDPEFSMKTGAIPGTKIGTFNADDINDAIDILANIVKKNNLAPKVLIVHRFTQGMVTDYKRIKIIPEVQVVINMDGFGNKILKKSTYKEYIYKEPIQFTGFKLFYKNDTKKDPNGMFIPDELLKLTPKPIYIQYQ